jgi:hypothetical protein
MPMREQKRGFTVANSTLTAAVRRLGAVALGSGLAMFLGAWLWAVASPDRLLERSYARVTPQGTLFLDDAGASGSPNGPLGLSIMQVKASGAAPMVQQPVLVVDGEPVPSGILSEPLAAGDRVQIRGADTVLRTIEVQEAAEVGAPVVGMPGVRLQLVTARYLDVRRAEAEHLVFAVRAPEPAKVIPAMGRTAGKVL